MGKHSGPSGDSAGTDAGKPFDEMTGEEKASEFDASVADASGYAARNFGAFTSTGQQYESARAEQREQQDRTRGQ